MTDTPRFTRIGEKWAGDPDARGYREEIEELAQTLEREQAAAFRGTEMIAAMLSDERMLADRLANVLATYNHDLRDCEAIRFVPEHDAALAAYKKARNPAQNTTEGAE